MDETFQQAYANTIGTVTGNFLTGLILPPGSTLPTNDQGPIAMGETWYFWDTTTGQYLPQATTQKGVRNYVRNSSYWVAQQGPFTATTLVGSGNTYDMVRWATTVGSLVTLSDVAGPPATSDNDLIPHAMQYQVSTPLATPAVTDVFNHVHIVEGIDINPLQGQVMSLSFSVFTNVAGTYSISLINNAADTCYVANFTVPANAWTRVKISGIPPFPTTLGTFLIGEGQSGLYIRVSLGVGANHQTATLNQWISGNFSGSSSNITSFFASAINTFAITGVKLEPAAGPTYYQCPTFDAEFDSVIRYWWTNFNYQSLTAGIYFLGVTPNYGAAIFAMTFSRRMCRAPVVVPYSIKTTPVAGYFTDLYLGNDIAQSTLGAYPKGIISYIGSYTGSSTGNTHTSTTIDGIPSTTGLVAGMGIAGSGIPFPATIVSVASGTSVIISVASTTTVTGVALTFYQVNKGDVVAAYVTADARLS